MIYLDNAATSGYKLKIVVDAMNNALKKYNANSLLVTQKDYVKIKDFGLSVSILDLKTTISPNFANKIKLFIKSYQNSDTIYPKL